jgi:hypothetical protein
LFYLSTPAVLLRPRPTPICLPKQQRSIRATTLQYIPRLLVSGAIEGVKVGQVWLVMVSSLNEYLNSIRRTSDRRFGPRLYQEYIEIKES